MTGDKVLRQIRNSWIVQLENWWELEAVQSPLLLDSCLPRLRSRRLGSSRAGHWTRSSVLRKMDAASLYARILICSVFEVGSVFHVVLPCYRMLDGHLTSQHVFFFL